MSDAPEMIWAWGYTAEHRPFRGFSTEPEDDAVRYRRADLVDADLAERDAEIAGLRDGLVRIIDAWDGDSESMHDDPAVIARAALAGDARIVEDYIDIVFDGPPGPVAGRFVEVEDSARRSIRFGEWTKRDDGFWVLRVANEQASAHRSAQIRAACQTALRALDTYEAMYRHHMTVQLYSARAGLREALDGRN